MEVSFGNLDQSCAGDLEEQLRAARSSGGAYQLPARLLVRLSGQDAFRYINGQVTRDLARLSAGEALSACLLTPKGKICAPILIRRDEKSSEDLLVEADPVLEEALLARLERYIVADDVTLSVEKPRRLIHLFGSLSAEKFWSSFPGLRLTRLGVPGLDLDADWIGEGKLPLLFDPRVIETLRIERGIPAWGREITGETLPPEVGFDHTHIDYDRGCYPGQEVVSRLKSIGRVNRLLRLVLSEPGTPLNPGMILQNGEGKKLGAISSAEEQFDTGAWVALAILPRETLDALFALDPLTGEKTPISIIKITGS